MGASAGVPIGACAGVEEWCVGQGQKSLPGLHMDLQEAQQPSVSSASTACICGSHLIVKENGRAGCLGHWGMRRAHGLRCAVLGLSTSLVPKASGYSCGACEDEHKCLCAVCIAPAASASRALL